MKTKHLIYLLGISILFYTCSSSSTDDVSDPDPDPDPTTKITYKDDIKAIIDGNCIGCHAATPTNGAPSSYVTYTQVKNGVNNIISRIKGSPSIMPPSNRTPLTAAQISMIEQWKTDGLLEE